MLKRSSRQHALGSALWLTQRRPKPLDPDKCGHPPEKVTVIEERVGERWNYSARCTACGSLDGITVPRDVGPHKVHRLQALQQFLGRSVTPNKKAWADKALRRYCKEFLDAQDRRF